MNDITITDLRSIKNYFPKKSVENYINKILLKKFNSKIQYCQCSLFFESQDKQKNKYFFRDKLGIHKFFYCYRKKQEILIANNLYILVKNGCRIENIKSFKPGVLYHLNKDNVIEAINYSNFLEKNSNFHDLESLKTKIKKKLISVFKNISYQYKNHNFVVCLSGGLDSSIIAYYAKNYLINNNLFFTSFSLTETNQLKSNFKKFSKDMLIAKKFSKKLNVKFIQVNKEKSISQNELQKIIISSQDYRDFNVHCAALNYFLAERLAKNFDVNNTIVITGDLMNEFLIDYKEEDIKGKKYYKLPKVPNRKLRNFLISGLDTSDREVGVFHKFGFYVIQPYNALVYQYLAIHPDYLSQKNFKLKFNGDMIPSTLFKLIPKKKNRAQTANDNLGILDLFIDKNITQNDLMKKFNKIYCSKSANEIIDIGRYRN